MNTFTVTFSCRNCGNEWAEEFQPGDAVKEQWDGVWVESRACTHGHDCPACRRVKCEVCLMAKDVRVIKREPIRVGS